MYDPCVHMPFLTSGKISTSSGYDVQKFYLTISMLLSKSIQNHHLFQFQHGLFKLGTHNSQPRTLHLTSYYM